MKIAIITYGHILPFKGGVAQHINNLFNFINRNKSFKIYVFNQYTADNKVFKILNRKEYSSREILFELFNKRVLYFLIKSIWCIVIDDRTPFSHKVKILSYLLLKPRLLIKTINNVADIYPYLNNLDVDLIIGAYAGTTLPLIFILSRIFNKKVISLAHGNDFLYKKKEISSISYFFKNLDKIILSNKKTKFYIKNIHHLTEDQLKIIPYGLNLKNYKLDDSKAKLRRDFKIPEEKFILISVGRHVFRKNFDLVIKAVSRIKNEVPNINIKYYLIGDGPETEKLKNLTKELNLNNEVEFLGTFGGLKRNQYYKLSDIFLMPSVATEKSIEGFGIVFLEANYFKLPVIGSFSGGMTEAIIHNKTGFLIKPNDLNDLVRKIKLLYENEDMRSEMGEYGYNRVVNYYNWDKITIKFKDFFNSL
ncbi:MAG: glycosyltransferase family 4 protein [Promethearchaeota archaeon]